MEDKNIIVKESTIENLYSYNSFLQVPYNLLCIPNLSTATIIWLSFMLSYQEYFRKNNKLDEDGYFFYSQRRIQEKIPSITVQMQIPIIKKLKEIGILLVKEKIGLPARNYYKIDYERLFEFIQENESQRNISSDIKSISQEKINDKQYKNNINSDIKSISQEINEVYDINILNNNIKKEYFKISSKEDIYVFPAEKQSSTSQEKPYDKDLIQIKPTLHKRKPKIDRSKYVTMPSEKEQNLSVSPVSQKVIDYWNALGLKKTKMNTKSLHSASTKILKIIRGMLYISDDILVSKYPLARKKFTVEEIKDVIYQFHLAALNSEYEPSGKYKNLLKKIDINSFLYNSFSDNGHRSLFLKYATEKPKQRVSKSELTPEDKVVADKIIAFYRKNVLGRTKAPLLPNDKNKLVEASNKLISFFKENGNHIVSWAKSSNLEMADLFCNAMEKIVDDELNGDWSKLNSGYFKSDTTFLRRFPAYLNSQAAIEQEEEWSIYRTPDGKPYVSGALGSYNPDLDD